MRLNLARFFSEAIIGYWNLIIYRCELRSRSCILEFSTASCAMLEGVQKQVAENVTVALAVIAVTIAMTGIFWQRRRLWYLSWRLEGPIYKPIVGNIFDFGSSAQCK